MEKLGERNTAALVRETETEWELIVSHELLARLDFEERVVARFRFHPKLPVTQRWRLGDHQPWQVWNDETEAVGLIPDLSTAWIEDAILTKK